MYLIREDIDKPCIQDVDPDFLCSCLDRSNLFIGDSRPKIIITHMPKIGLPDEQTRFGAGCVDMFFQLRECQICLESKAQSYIPPESKSCGSVLRIVDYSFKSVPG